MKFRRSFWWLGGAALMGGLTLFFWPRTGAPQPVAVATTSRQSLRPPAPRPALSAAAPAASGRTGAGAREVFAANWKTDARPAFAAFRDWTARYLAAAPAERAKLLAEGIELARQRRELLAQLIRTDPRAALAAAVPMVVRQQLPGAVVDLLEDRVSGRGELALNAVTPLPGQTPAQSSFRSVLLDDQEYRAYVYGRRETQSTVSTTSIVGIAIDHALAVSESPLRVLEPGETAANRPLDVVCAISGNITPAGPTTALNVSGEATAVEYNGKVQVLCHISHVSALEQQLLASEADHIQTLADNQPGSSSVLGRPDSSWTHGPKKMLVIRVDFSDLPGTPVNTYVDSQPITPATIDNVINGTNGVNTFYINSSYGQSSIQLASVVAGVSADVTPVLRLPQTAAYYAAGDGTNAYDDTLHSDARALALALGYNEANYDRVGVVFTSLANTPSSATSKITYGGLGEVIGKHFWVNGEFDLRVVAHEVGHNYGLYHANLWFVTDGNPVSPNGSSTEYGDDNDVMGSGNTYVNEFTHWNKSILQWIPDSAVTLATTANTYRIYRFDGGTATNLANPRALKIVRNATQDYWIGYRRGDNNASLMNGAYIIWGYNTNQQGNLLDMTTPGTNVDDAGLAIGTTFNDTVAGITITPVMKGGIGSEEYLDVQVGFQARVQWSQTAYTVDAQGGSATLTLNRTQSGSGAVSVNYATSDGTAAAPANYTTSNGTVTWLDGDTADKTVIIPLVAGSLATASANFTVTLGGVTGGVIGGSPAATVTMVAPGVRDSSFAPGFIDNTVHKLLPQPDGSVVVAGTFDLLQDASYTIYNHAGVARLTATGALDPAFAAGAGAAGGNGYTDVYDLTRQPDGKIIIVGEFSTYNGATCNRIARLNVDGTVDTSFNPGGGADDTIHTVLVQPDGHILIGGAFANYNGTGRQYLARLNSDGSLDTSLVGPGFIDPGFGGYVQSLALQPDGKILVGGFYQFSGAALKASICRVLANGALDSAFNGVSNGANYPGYPSFPGYVARIIVQPDGKILIGGTFDGYNNTSRGGVARLTSTGALDPTFVPPTIGNVNALLLQPDGNVLVGAGFWSSPPARYLSRLSSTGANDTVFAAAGDAGSDVDDLALLPNGRVLFGGIYSSFQGSSSSGPVWQFFPGLPGLPGTLQLASATYSGTEGGTVVLSVTRAGGSLGALTAGYATVNGSAIGGADYLAQNGVLTWADGDTATKTISIPLTLDALTEGTETFTFNLGQPLIGGAQFGAIQQATVQISDVPPGFATWQLAKFTAGELSNINISGPNAVYGQDGLPNLVKYALGLEPKQNITTGLPVVSTTGTDWVYTYTRPTGTTDVTYAVEVSTDLVNWSTAGVTHEIVSSSGGTETWHGRYPLASAANVFFRLVVTR